MIIINLHVCLFHTFSFPVELQTVVRHYSFCEITDQNIRSAVELTSKGCLLVYGPMEWWDTSKVTHMNGLFNSWKSPHNSPWNRPNFNLDISNWDVSSVIDYETHVSQLQFISINR